MNCRFCKISLLDGDGRRLGCDGCQTYYFDNGCWFIDFTVKNKDYYLFFFAKAKKFGLYQRSDVGYGGSLIHIFNSMPDITPDNVSEKISKYLTFL